MSLLHWTQMLLFSGLLGVAPAFARGPSLQEPILLAATPAVSGTYARTVLLALPTGRGKHIGLILNRPSRVQVAALFPDAPEAKQLAAPIYVGGPLLRDTLIALTRSPLRPSEEALELLPDLYLSFGNGATAQVAARQPGRSRFYAGLVAWEEGELEAELRAGAWHVLEPDAELVMGGSADSLWERAFQRTRTLIARVSSSGDTPS